MMGGVTRSRSRFALAALLLFCTGAHAQLDPGGDAGGHGWDTGRGDHDDVDDGAAHDRRRKPPDPCAPHAQLYVSAMGEPFRAPAGAADPIALWFAQADANHDGGVTLVEFVADADRLFAKLDRNHDGEIDPQEVSAYEIEIAPEIRLYQRGAPIEALDPKHRPKKGDNDYGGAMGAGRYAQLNIPEPVASADEDFNRGVSKAEFDDTARQRFAQLDIAHAGALTIAAMAPTPQQQIARDCAAKAAKDAAKRKR